MPKQYDQAYFDRWYRGPDRVHDRGEVRRKVGLAITTAEYFLRRPITAVLDVGCGEGAWFPHIRAMRRAARYEGLDASEYAVARFGASRHIRKGTFGDLPNVRGKFDLVVCSDVLHYVQDEEIRRGAAALPRITAGIAFIEVLTREDDIIGDLEGLIRRPSSWYRRLFESEGFVQVAPYCWLTPSLRDDAAELEVVK